MGRRPNNGPSLSGMHQRRTSYSPGLSSLPSLDAPPPPISRRSLRFEKPPQKETPREWLTFKEKLALAKLRSPKAKLTKSNRPTKKKTRGTKRTGKARRA